MIKISVNVSISLLIEVYLFLRSFSRFRGSFGFLLFFLTIESFFPVLEVPPLIFFLTDVSLNAEHQKDLLPQFIVKFHIFLSGNNLIGDIHAL